MSKALTKKAFRVLNYVVTRKGGTAALLVTSKLTALKGDDAIAPKLLGHMVNTSKLLTRVEGNTFEVTTEGKVKLARDGAFELTAAEAVYLYHAKVHLGLPVGCAPSNSAHVATRVCKGLRARGLLSKGKFEITEVGRAALTYSIDHK